MVNDTTTRTSANPEPLSYTHPRKFRAGDELWEAFGAHCAELETNISARLRYLMKQDMKASQRQGRRARTEP